MNSLTRIRVFSSSRSCASSPGLDIPVAGLVAAPLAGIPAPESLQRLGDVRLHRVLVHRLPLPLLALLAAAGARRRKRGPQPRPRSLGRAGGPLPRWAVPGPASWTGAAEHRPRAPGRGLGRPSRRRRQSLNLRGNDGPPGGGPAGLGGPALARDTESVSTVSASARLRFRRRRRIPEEQLGALLQRGREDERRRLRRERHLQVERRQFGLVVLLRLGHRLGLGHLRRGPAAPGRLGPRARGLRRAAFAFRARVTLGLAALPGRPRGRPEPPRPSWRPCAAPSAALPPPGTCASHAPSGAGPWTPGPAPAPTCACARKCSCRGAGPPAAPTRCRTPLPGRGLSS